EPVAGVLREEAARARLTRADRTVGLRAEVRSRRKDGRAGATTRPAASGGPMRRVALLSIAVALWGWGCGEEDAPPVESEPGCLPAEPGLGGYGSDLFGPYHRGVHESL